MFSGRAFSLYLLSLFLIGVGYIAITPPFEGFDELSHYASLRQIADTKTIPLFGRSYLPQDVAGYRGPIAYSSRNPPFDSGLTYAKFFAQPESVARFVRDYGQPQPPPVFVPSDEANWEAQHPPLYYLILAPVMHLVESSALVNQILVLRLASYMLALAGVFLGLEAIPAAGTMINPVAASAGFLLYPVMLPMFFPEFARIGNDSLCLLLAGLAAFLLTKGLANESKTRWPAALGVCLGLGLLTKAFFLPITFVLGVFLLLRCWSSGDNKARRMRLRNSAIVLAVAAVIGGGWYIYNALANGVLIGGDDAFVRQSDFWTRIKQNLSVYDLARSGVVAFTTWIWAGTWSLARMSLSLYVPMLLMVSMTIGAFAAQLRRTPLAEPVWLPVLLVAIFSCGLLYHVVLVSAYGGVGGTAGWYFNILMPWTAPALGSGVMALGKRAWTRLLLTSLLCYGVLFQAMAVWAQVALFTGCAVKGSDKYYSFSGSAFCLDQAETIYDRLAIIGWPNLALVGFSGGLVCAGCLVLRLQRRAVPI
jgi:hypothetical protein